MSLFLRIMRHNTLAGKTHTNYPGDELSSHILGYLFEESPDGVIITGRDLRTIKVFNRGAEKLSGISAKESIGMPVNQLYVDPSERAGLLKRLEHENTVTYETYFRRWLKGGEDTIYVSFTLSFIKDKQGRKIGTLGFLRDMTHKKDLEDMARNHTIETIHSLYRALENFDPYTRNHTINVTEYSGKIARELGMDQEEIDRVEKAASLHDIGKMETDKDSLLSRRVFLGERDSEMVHIMEHTKKASEILGPYNLPPEVAQTARFHHERMDGKGYPEGLRGRRIPLFARIVAVADAYDSMTTDRLYRGKMSKNIALAEMKRCSGLRFDRRLLASHNKKALSDIVDREVMHYSCKNDTVEAALNLIPNQEKRMMIGDLFYDNLGDSTKGSQGTNRKLKSLGEEYKQLIEQNKDEREIHNDIMRMYRRHRKGLNESDGAVIEFLARIVENSKRYLVDRMKEENQFDPEIVKALVRCVKKKFI